MGKLLMAVIAAIMVLLLFLWVYEPRQEEVAGPVYYRTGSFCSTDGKVWYPTRDDGMCYAADRPDYKLGPRSKVCGSGGC